jgi:hypothetical protein
MKEIINLILEGKLIEAKEKLDGYINQKIQERIFDKKLDILEEVYGIEDYEIEIEPLSEKRNVTQRVGQAKIVRVRVRGGQIQKGKKFAASKGYTIRNGKIVRMSPQEIQKRKAGARKAKMKRRSTMQQALRKRRLSLKRRKVIGI